MAASPQCSAILGDFRGKRGVSKDVSYFDVACNSNNFQSRFAFNEGATLMKVTALICAAIFASTMAASAGTLDRTIRYAQARVCAQVISCGTKNGVRKEYPTPCAAEDDGATDIRPKTGATCEAATK
jgi:hypothetical protein